MHGCQKLILALCLALLCAPMLDASSVRMPPGSFIVKPVTSGADIADQILENKLVSARYTTHYGLSAQEIADYFREHTTLSTLEKTGVHHSYFIAVNGRIQSKNKTLAAGTRVILAHDRTLLIEADCGNPLTKRLPYKPVVEVKAETPAAGIAITQVVEAEPEPKKETPIPDLPPVPMTMVTADELPAPVELEPEVQVLADLPMELLPAVVSASSANWIVPALAGVGAVGSLVGSRSPDGVIPEPATLITLCLGGSGILAARLRSRRRQKR